MYLTRNEKNAEITYLLVGYFKNWQLYKGQLISKCLWFLQFSQKTNKKIDFTTMVPHVELFSFVFWEN